MDKDWKSMEVALEIAASMTYPENLTLTVLKEKLDNYGMDSENLSHGECVQLFYNNLAALPCRHISTAAQEKKTTFTTFSSTSTKNSSKPASTSTTIQPTTASTPEMDRLLSRSKSIKTKPATTNQLTCDAPKAKVIKLNRNPKTTEVKPSSEPNEVVKPCSDPKTEEVKPSSEPNTEVVKPCSEPKTEEVKPSDEPKAKQRKIDDSNTSPPPVVRATITSPCKQQEVTAAKKPKKLQRNFFPTPPKSG